MVEWTAADIPDLSHRIAVVTGANSGIGLETAKELARAGATVIMACRSIDRGTAARAELVEELGRDRHPRAGTGGGDGRTVEDRLVVSELDLTRPDSIDGFVSRLAQWRSDTAERLSVAAERSGETERPGEPARSGEPAQTGHLRYGGDGLAAGIDLLINNAGIMACPPSLTEQGVERQWASNHLGHFALTGRLLPFMVDGGRVVSVSSLAAQGGDLSKPIPTTLDDYSRFQVYSDTKLANQVFAVELNHRLAASGSTTISLAAHPGISHTNLGAGLGIPIATTVLKGLSRLMTQSPVVGALPTLRAATDPKAEGGQYYGPSGRNQHRGPPKQLPLVTGASRRSLGRDLWEQSMELTGVRYLTGG